MHVVHVTGIPEPVVAAHLATLRAVSRVLLDWAHTRVDGEFVPPEHLPADYRTRWLLQAVFRDMTVRRHPNGLDVCRARTALQFDYCKQKSTCPAGAVWTTMCRNPVAPTLRPHGRPGA